MASRTLHTVDLLQSIALSGTANVTIAVPANAQDLVVRISAEYAAVAATTGITASFQTSVDGTTFVAAGEGNVVLKPGAGVLGSSVAVFRLGNDPFKLDTPSYLNSVKVTLTNADATNAAVCAISHESSNFSI